MRSKKVSSVMAGLVTASRIYPTCGIQPCESRAGPTFAAIYVSLPSMNKAVDARRKAGHDGGEGGFSKRKP
jgi:hypothetical protein